MTKVLAGGCFNKLHEGHLHFLKKAKELGDELVVVLANDSHNKKSYAIPAPERKENLERCGIADKVLIGDKDQFVGVVIKEKPQVIALGYDQQLPKDVEEKLAELSVKVEMIDKFKDVSTRNLS